MKKSFLIPGFITTALFLIMLSCSKNSSDEIVANESNSINSNKLLKNNSSLNSIFSRSGNNNISFEAILDSAGKWHNDYQEYLLTKITQSSVALEDTVALKTLINSESTNFFVTKNLTFENRYSENKLAKSTSLIFPTPSVNISTEASVILDELQAAVLNFDSYDQRFINKLNNLKSRALSLQDSSEKIIVGVPVSVALHSYDYWNQNASRWEAALQNNRGEQYKTGGFGAKKKCVNLYQLGGADVAGAVSGAYGGLVAGPGGALAGGVLGSATSSLYNLTNQVIGCYVSWWPF